MTSGANLGAEPADTVLDAWRLAVSAAPGEIALRAGEQTWTRGDVDAESDALAHAFESYGVRRGDRVCVQLQNVPEFALSVLAAWKLAAAVVPINPMYRADELRAIVADATPRLIVCDHADYENVVGIEGDHVVVGVGGELDPDGPADIPRRFADLVACFRGRRLDPIQVTGAEMALLSYTSGTTGPAKGAIGTHANVRYGAGVYATEAGVLPGSVILAVAPLSHITGMIGGLAAALAGTATLVLNGRFVPGTALDAIESAGVTFTIAAMTAVKALLEEFDGRSPADRPRLDSITSLYSGGAPVPPGVAQEVRSTFGITLGNAYGLTETTSIAILTPLGEAAPIDVESGALAVGRAARGVELRLLDEDGSDVAEGAMGELAVRSPGVVNGYWRNPTATEAAFVDGWLRTGDVARRDSDGWYYIVDRKKDQINASGFKIWPREVEDVLYRHPAVREVVVVGIPDGYRGESVLAVVVPNDRTASPQELAAFVREHLAAYKVPREFEFVDELPRTPSGKLQRGVVRDRRIHV